jgi:hypothetical protein
MDTGAFAECADALSGFGDRNPVFAPVFQPRSGTAGAADPLID